MSLFTTNRIITRSLASKLKTMSTSPSLDNLAVVHKSNLNKFVIDLPPQPPNHPSPSQAILDYDWLNANKVDLHHTEVPEHFQGRGIAKLLAKTALDYFSEKNIKMELTCSYLVKYVKDTNYGPLPK
ncbi:protein NATD1-like [Argonauta hians]